MWRLVVDKGRQVWHHYVTDEERSQSQDDQAAAGEEFGSISALPDDFDLDTKLHGFGEYDPNLLPKTVEDYLLTKPPNIMSSELETEGTSGPTQSHEESEDVSLLSQTRVLKAVRNAIRFLEAIQTKDGHWAGDYGGPLFLLPALVIVCYICEIVLPETHRREMIRYMLNHQNSDGGWGLHIEGESIMFTSVLNYVALRILGLDSENKKIAHARAFILSCGGALAVPQWGKFWLCVLGLMKWDGMNPITPELWLLPRWFPFHPLKMWCHSRVCFLGMGFLFGMKRAAPETPLTVALRNELYVQNYHTIDFSKFRSHVFWRDVYRPVSPVMRILTWALNKFEKFHVPFLRKIACNVCLEHIKYEDEQTNFICIGPVNKVLNMLSVFFAEGRNSEHFRSHIPRIYDYLWLSCDGMKMNGYNGSQLWDTAFATQAIISSGLADEFQTTLIRAHDYIDITQVRENSPNAARFGRHKFSKGAWPFSTRDHGWPISDCTAEGLKAALLCRDLPFISTPLEESRLADAVNVILSMQNKNGGWATYELQRAGTWLEILNPMELFGDLMVDYPYVECTSTCIGALKEYLLHFPESPRSCEIRMAIEKGVKFVKSMQRPDGSWLGSWGICFCYGTWFGISGLVDSGLEDPRSSEVIRHACQFLVRKQLPDGGWGESHLSSYQHEYVHSEHSQIVSTAWALLALMKADFYDIACIKRGINLLLRRQLPNGDFPQEHISGVFNGSCAITYANYHNIFPIWALSVFARKFADTDSTSEEPMNTTTDSS